MRFTSLRLQLLSGLLAPVMLIVGIDVAIASRNARAAANIVTDRTLYGAAKSIAEQIRDNSGQLEAVVPPAAIEMFESSERDLVYYQVFSPNGTLLVGYAELPTPPDVPSDGSPVYYDTRFRGADVRLVALRQPVPTSRAIREALVVVGETTRGRDALVARFSMQTAEQQVVLVALTFALLWFVLKNRLAALVRVGQEVAARKPDEFAPIPLERVYDELQPFTIALNRYMGRLGEQLEARKRFTANAAHQLRTPLTLLRTQAQFASTEAPSEFRPVIAAILATTRQMTRLTNQLLLLSRAEAQRGRVLGEPCDMTAIVREALVEHADAALAQGIDLAFEAESAEPIFVRGDALLLHEMIANLVDNALQYTPRGGSVEADLRARDGRCAITLADTGPGIPLEKRSAVFERFMRLASSDVAGSGLGLAIVKEIAAAFGGTVTIADAGSARGCTIVVDLPTVARPASPNLPERFGSIV